MPIYEYECASCAREFETLVRKSAPPPRCPGCDGTDLRKKLSSFAAITGAVPARAELPAACHSCGGNPGSCGFNANLQ